MGKLVVSDRYANSLFSVGLELNELDKFQKELNMISETLASSDELLQVLVHPRITDEEKKSVVDSLFKQRVSNEIINFLYVVIDKGRESVILEIIDIFNDLYDQYKGHIKVTAVTAIPISEDQKEKLIKKLEDLTKMNVNLTNEIDPSILGGMLIKTKNRVIDGTVASELESIRDTINKVSI